MKRVAIYDWLMLHIVQQGPAHIPLYTQNHATSTITKSEEKIFIPQCFVVCRNG